MEMPLGKRGPQAVPKLFRKGTSAEWREAGQTVIGQIWAEHPDDHAIWLAVSGGFPGEMRIAKHGSGRITNVDRTVYNCLGEQTQPEPTTGEVECTQGKLFEYDAPAPKTLDTLPLF